MHITYILKKGFQFYPPCLAQVLYLDDMGVELTVYHGEDSEYLNRLFEKRGISHFVLESDSLRKGKFQGATKLLKYTAEVRRILNKLPKDEIIWFGNCESAMSLGRQLEGRRFVLSVLELYDNDKLRDGMLDRVIRKATVVTCCEKHRAAIMKSRYRLKKLPYVMPNKPYPMEDDENHVAHVDKKIISFLEAQKQEGRKILLYQGLIDADRPLLNIAKGLRLLGDDKITFVILGKGDEMLLNELPSYYNNIRYLGFLPNPLHLAVTRYADIGIANYDFSCLNNVFCAPNKIYEYAQYSVPMLVSDNVGLVETVGDYGAAECVDFSDTEEIKKGLKRIVREYETYKKNAKTFYDATDNRSVMEAILDEIVPRRECGE